MSFSFDELNTFSQFFQGNVNAYGSTIVGPTINGKAEANSHLEHSPVTAAVWNRHLNGEESIGIAPIMDDGNCYFGVIDIDNYDYDLTDIIDAIEDFELPLIPCWSKSKKLHIYILFSEPTKASDVIKICEYYKHAFACREKTEVFPKQSKTSEKYTFYSWINLPYFDANNRENHRKMVGKNGKLYSINEFVEIAGRRRRTHEEHLSFIKDMPYSDAPPCVLSGVLLRDVGPGQRNDWLFSVGVYLRMKDETVDLNDELTKVNESLHSPIPNEELYTTIIRGFTKKTYFYKCSVLERCDEKWCRKQAFGKGSTASTGLEYGELTQIMTDPPYYEWIVNGQKLTFYNENEMLMQNKFRALCMRQLHIVPNRAKDDVWSGILTRALSNVRIVEPNTGVGDFSTGSLFLDAIYDFFRARREADNITQIMMGRVYKNKEREEFVFTAAAFISFLQDKKGMRMSSIEMRSRLIELGAHKQDNAWYLPFGSVPELKKDQVKIEYKPRATEDTDVTDF